MTPIRTLRRTLLSAGMGIIALGVAACGSTSGSTVSVMPSNLVSSLSPAKVQVAVVRWNLYGEPTSIDPDNPATYSSGTVSHNLCDGLLTVDAKYNTMPNLASYRVVTPTKVVFTIREGVRFWDGKPMTAADVAYSLQRAANPNYLSGFIFANVRDIAVSGPMKVTVTFKRPDELFLSEMTVLDVMEKAYSQKVGSALGTSTGGVMCTGPYKLVKWTPGSSIVLTRNDDYWNHARRGFAKTINFSLISDSTTLAQALNSGEIDGGYQIPADAIPALRKSTTGRLTFGPSMEGTYLFQAHPGGVLANAKVLEALQIGIDRAALARVIYHGAAMPLYTLLTPATWPNDVTSIYQKAYQKFASTRAYDPTRAKQLMASSGYRGQPIVLAYEAGDATGSLTAQFIQQQAQEIGLTVKLQALQPLVYDQASYTASQRTGFDLLLFYNFNAAHDPLELIEQTYLPGSAYNYTNFNDAQATQSIHRAEITFNDAERAKLMVQAQDIYEAPNNTIPLVGGFTTTFLSNSLTGAVTSLAYWQMPSMAFIGGAR